MSLFNRPKGPDPIAQMNAAGGNFNYIAQTIATQYFILTQTDYAWTISEGERMYAVALINSASALRSGDIDMQAIRSAAEDSYISMIHLDDFSQCHGGWVSTEYERFCNLVLQIEAIVFRAYTPEDSETIISGVLQNKSEIFSMIKRTLQQGKNGPLYIQYFPVVMNMINDHVFRYLVEAHSKIIDLEYREIELLNEINSLSGSEV